MQAYNYEKTKHDYLQCIFTEAQALFHIRICTDCWLLLEIIKYNNMHLQKLIFSWEQV